LFPKLAPYKKEVSGKLPEIPKRTQNNIIKSNT
jgi:hypothetical protein